MAIIPQQLKDIADNLGYNRINFVKTTNKGDVFSLFMTDMYGNTMDIGTPVLFCSNGSVVEPLSDEEADEILKSIKE